MAHYAFLDDNNIVTHVIVGRDENEVVDGITDWETYYGNFQGQTCKRTSYNTVAGTHLLGGTPFRKNYAGMGMVYDPVRDAFYSVQPFPSWVLDEDTCLWDAPVAYPDDGLMYYWDEASQSWQEVTDGL